MLLRVDALSALGQRAFDVLVVGGGITGAGTARDAAMRGLRVALVEKNDFASGTSSRSSRLVHGGVRYLEHGQLHLVFESSRERRTLMRMAAHLVHPLAFTWPVYDGARIPRWKLAAGLTLYDALSLFRNVGRHRWLGVSGILRHEPRVRTEGLRGGALYFDASTDDARLTLANVMAAVDAGAIAVNHAGVVELLREGGRVSGARIRDGETGALTDVRARVVVNATGPWSDQLETMARSGAASGVRGSKGVHVCVPRMRVGNGSALTLIAPQDGRVMFVLPSGDFTIIGTTDTFDAVSPDDVRANETDVAYLLAAANHYFPSAMLTRDDVVSAWAGLRPLAIGSGATRDDPGSTSREHAIAETAPGLVRVTGGKLTTYRAMSSEITDRIQQALGVPHTRSRTDTVPLPGAMIGNDLASAEGTPRLLARYGTIWREVAALVERDPALGARVTPERPYLLAELRYAVEGEMARTMGDLLIRRTPIAFETRDHGRDAARRVAPMVAEWLQRDAASVIAEYDAEAARMFRIDP
ncbi:MAG: glycerol-3-phosphate dehydrogenase/oxidase [Gemmatimonadaceae bacterium]